MPEDPKMIRVRLDEPFLSEWEGILRAHKISGQSAVSATLVWLAKQDPLTRALIFGQVPDTDHAALSRLVLERLGQVDPKSKAKK